MSAASPTGSRLRFAGIDPGKRGGLAVIDDGGVPVHELCVPMPIVGDARQSSARVDPRLLSEWVRHTITNWPTYRTGGGSSGPIVVAAIEEARALPGDSIKSISSILWNHGALSALILEHGVRLITVPPLAWQKFMLRGLPRGKADVRNASSLRRAADLFPSVKQSGTHDGVAEALLIAEWLRRRELGLPSTHE